MLYCASELRSRFSFALHKSVRIKTMIWDDYSDGSNFRLDLYLTPIPWVFHLKINASLIKIDNQATKETFLFGGSQFALKTYSKLNVDEIYTTFFLNPSMGKNIFEHIDLLHKMEDFRLKLQFFLHLEWFQKMMLWFMINEIWCQKFHSYSILTRSLVVEWLTH